MRIVSLVPSFTELLFDLKLDDNIVGVTRFCVHPKHKTKLITKVGGTKKINLKVIEQLKPDLIIANKEENQREDIELLRKTQNVWLTEITTINDAFSMIKELGNRTLKQAESARLISEIEQSFSSIQVPSSLGNTTVAYLIWESPIMLAGRDTFINHLLSRIGFENILLETNSRYPEKSIEQLQKLNPNFIFLSSEPFPFKIKHKLQFESLFPDSKVVLVDGEMFSWYGSRMKLAGAYFNKLTHTLT